ncbi:MAG: VOC family protein [Pseudomonadota bacterium]
MSIEPFFDCRDISASIEFYTQVLDFELAVAPDPDPEQFGSRYAAVSRGGGILHLSSHARANGVFGATIYIRVNNVDELCERFLANGLTLTVPVGGTSPVDQTWGMREIGFRDPDGNKISYGQTLT